LGLKPKALAQKHCGFWKMMMSREVGMAAFVSAKIGIN
jgi:hypothetical protein